MKRQFLILIAASITVPFWVHASWADADSSNVALSTSSPSANSSPSSTTNPSIGPSANTTPSSNDKSHNQSEDPKESKASSKATHPKNQKLADKPVLDEPTIQAIATLSQKLDLSTRQEFNRLSDAMSAEDRAINNELRDEEELSASDMGMLWEAAVEHSGTIRYAIEKLSRRDATGKAVDNDSFTKKMVENLVRLGGVAGTMWTGTPSSMIGSSMVNGLMSPDPTNSALSHVTDADMIILAKEVEALQTQLLEVYYNYRHAQERLALTKEATTTIQKYYENTMVSPQTPEALQPLIQSVYDNTQQDAQNAKQSYDSTRSALILLVGSDAVVALDKTGKGNPNS